MDNVIKFLVVVYLVIVLSDIAMYFHASSMQIFEDKKLAKKVLPARAMSYLMFGLALYWLFYKYNLLDKI